MPVFVLCDSATGAGRNFGTVRPGRVPTGMTLVEFLARPAVEFGSEMWDPATRTFVARPVADEPALALERFKLEYEALPAGRKAAAKAYVASR